MTAPLPTEPGLYRITVMYPNTPKWTGLGTLTVDGNWWRWGQLTHSPPHRVDTRYVSDAVPVQVVEPGDYLIREADLPEVGDDEYVGGVYYSLSTDPVHHREKAAAHAAIARDVERQQAEAEADPAQVEALWTVYEAALGAAAPETGDRDTDDEAVCREMVRRGVRVERGDHDG